MHEPHRNSLPLHSVEVEEDRSSLETNESSRGRYDILTNDGKALKLLGLIFFLLLVDKIFS